MATIKISKNLSDAIVKAHYTCTVSRQQFIMPAHLLMTMATQPEFKATLDEFNIDMNVFVMPITSSFSIEETVPDDMSDFQPENSYELQNVIARCALDIVHLGGNIMTIPHIVLSIWTCSSDEDAAKQTLYMFFKDNFQDFMKSLVKNYSESEKTINAGWTINLETSTHGAKMSISASDAVDKNGNRKPILSTTDEDPMQTIKNSPSASKEAWKKLVVCMNEVYEKHNRLIGRTEEIERAIQILCRKDKNNPLFIGDPGVGKTSIVYGLVRMIEEKEVPERLEGATVYMMDVATMVAGCQYRGEFEQRMKSVLDGIKSESENNIVFIDEIHSIIGAGSGNEALDGAGLLKPYLEDGNLRFIGTTTYEEFNKHIMKSQGFVRRFQNIDVAEPTIDEAKEIINNLKETYEKFHKVTYESGVVDYVVESSAKHILDRRLPDKAIDILDEAGSIVEIAAKKKGKRRSKKQSSIVTCDIIKDVLQKTCKVKAEVLTDDTNGQLKNLYDNISSKVFGQDEAVKSVVESVQMSKAGLLDENKPLASLLFVGPTGVGKTEVAKVLASELGVELLRFDMSEYTEKHAVAKLIGSPAGYVGYDDGGLLTDAIRKNPNCVLLLDEIEKAHEEIYNILLQVMDYARLTDNKGRKADFRNVVLIMTSNAGAQYASQASIGFTGTVTRGDAMLKQVKKTFKPEFINRLSGTIVFHDMSKDMAVLILKKKLGELQEKLTKQNVNMNLTGNAFETILEEGFVPEYGAREMDRVIAQKLKPLLMREILFGSLTAGGEITIDTNEDKELFVKMP